MLQYKDMRLRADYRHFALLLALLALGCTRRYPANLPPMQLNLYSGIKGVAYLGEVQKDVLRRRWKKRLVSPDEISQTKTSQITGGVEIRDLGIKVFFRRGAVGLIELRQPFHGRVPGKKDFVFGNEKKQGASWTETLMRRFGKPAEEASIGGLVRSRIFFYTWGDIVFNQMGISQIALYRHPDLREYRKQTAGQKTRMFGS